MYLEKIQKTGDIHKIGAEALPYLAEEIRQFLIENVSKTGGHLASNLGAVELTLALHAELDPEKDRIIWDVGHQAYTHKILTGRKEEFPTLRKYKGLSGFPKREESPSDAFDAGHASTSVSAALGYAMARDMQGQNYTVVAVIGDGSLTGGMAYEALNNAAKMNTNLIIILNDNEMAISENVGGMSKYLNAIRVTDNYLDLKDNVYDSLMGLRHGNAMVEEIRRVKKFAKKMVVPGSYFEDLGLTYMGPVDGHDIGRMRRMIREAQKVRGAVLLHVKTKKGKGYAPAENHPARFHGADPFLIENGLPANPRTKANYSDVFSTVMVKLAERDPRIVAITAAMTDGTGLKRFRNIYPDRFFDVGIAEEHAVTFAAGLAAGGMRPVVAVYSTFLQRSFDQIIHDVAMQHLPVIFALDRAGLCGGDGETHHGVFDLSYLSEIPGMTVLAPKNKWELSDMMKYALTLDGPCAIRYPRGEAYDGLKECRPPIETGVSEWIYEEEDICVLAVGSMVKKAEVIRRMLKDRGYSCSLVNARFVKPLDTDMLHKASEEHRLVVTLEENVITGGFGEQVVAEVNSRHIPLKVLPVALPDVFIPQGNPEAVYADFGLSDEEITEKIITNYVTA